jgi:uncharacterized protein (TIGR02594 family)
MFRITAFAGALLCLLSTTTIVNAETLHPRCNIDWPCVAAQSAKPAKNIQKLYTGQRDRFRNVELGSPMYPPETARSFLNGDLVSKARSFMGGNPTGWRSLWCGKFMSMIAPDAAKRVRNPNLARDWARLPHVSPQVGAIAVLKRGKGGHVGVVSGFDDRGNPIIVSGNHGKRVGEGVYPAGRVLAYESPS